MSKDFILKVKRRIHIRTSGCCNNNCIFCCDRDYHNGCFGLSKQYRVLYGVPYLTLKGFMKESKKIENIDSILFTGGEPTLNRNLISFIRLAKKLGYEDIGLQTNGRLLSYKNFCIKLMENGINEINISIHGSNKKVHDGLTRSRGAFKQAYQGLCNIVSLKNKYHLRIGTCFTITRLNYKDIYNYLKMLLSFNAIDNIALSTLMYTGNAERFFNQLVVPYKNIANEFKNAIGRLKMTKVDIRLSPMPFCLMVGYENYVGRQEMPISIQNRMPRQLLRGSTQIKDDKCISCRCYHYCSGIDSGYVKIIGCSEITPLKC